MTDNEIVSIDEAIRHCYEVYHERDDMCIECREEHRQLAKWLEELKESRETINRQKAEIERLQKQLKEGIDLSDDVFKIVKSEAYREFAVDLKCGVPQETGVIRCADVDATLKKLLSNDMGRYDHYTDSFVKEPTESNE